MDYNKALPHGGEWQTMLLKSAAADTYHIGMTVAIAAATGKIAYSALGGASPVVNAIAVEDKTVAIDGYVLCAVTGTDFDASGLVNDTGVAVTANAIDTAAALASGIRFR